MGSRSVSRAGAAVSLIAISMGLAMPAHAEEAAEQKPAAEEGQGRSNEIVVTARKRAESIQDVPAAVTAVTMEELTTRQVTGGPDLMTQVPNMTFTKTNFSGYSIQIRGIGTQAISVTTDPAVGVALNNTPFIRNRFFEQEFFDLERVEILRGPQGTLYGRNATAGVVNLVTAKPKFEPGAKLSVDIGSYNQIRTEGMINIPIVDDKVALRLAGAWTKRDGYVHNSITDKQIDGRDLWSTRASLLLRPTDNFEANFVWEHFNEKDDRLRSGKQLCKTDERTEVAGFPVTHFQILPDKGQSNGTYIGGVQSTFSQGCLPSSFYSDESYQTPNGLSAPYYGPLGAIGLPVALKDPYVSRFQSRNLREIESTLEPHYRARSNIFELQLGWDVADNLKLSSETAYSTDWIFSTQDFNRFNTRSGAFSFDGRQRPGVLEEGPVVLTQDEASGNGQFRTGIFCDPQLGCADRLVGMDLSTAKSTQFAQEFRLASNNDGPFNFNIGANFLRYNTREKFYVFFNSLSLATARGRSSTYLKPYVSGISDNRECMNNGLQPPDPDRAYEVAACTYMDPNPIGSLNDLGHNYFLSNNPYDLTSWSAFGEGYYDLTDTLKLTVGGRLTVDEKTAPRIPSWLVAGQTAGSAVSKVIEQRWVKPTGKISLDWKPDLSFTDSTLLYASVSRGYKAGGANPPSTGTVAYALPFGGVTDLTNALVRRSATRPETFDPEYVNAFEVGIKNELFNRTLTLNLAGFFYDYKGYQISQIVDRSAVNLNFDTLVWGAELESLWSPAENFQLGLKLGYQGSKLRKGSQAIDLMDRTAGNSDWLVVRPFPAYPSNCILPAALFQGVVPTGNGSVAWGPDGSPALINLGGMSGGNPGPCELAYQLGYDPVTGAPYVANPTTGGPLSMLAWKPGYEGWDPSTAPNGGEGFYTDISGNELPNAPHVTVSVNADYTIPLGKNWLATLHGDYYYQGKSWARIFNRPDYDRIKPYSTVNAALLLHNEASGWNIMAYVKNVFNKTAITGAFLLSDDTQLVTNMFLTEPRRYGLRVTKEFSGLPFGFGGTNRPHKPGTPWDVTIEGGVELLRHSGGNAPYRPTFADAYPTDIDAFTPIQAHRPQAWRDGTNIAVIVQPNDSPWKLTAELRYGKDGQSRRGRAEKVGDPICAYSNPADIDDCTSPRPVFTNWSDVGAIDSQKHLIGDFLFSHAIDLSPHVHSFIGFGVRYADLQDDTSLDIFGIPDNVQQNNILAKMAAFNRYQSYADIKREYHGAGPIVRWDGTADLFGTPETGMVGFDWALTGGLLFGRQKTGIEAMETDELWAESTSPAEIVRRLNIALGFLKEPSSETATQVSVSRRNRVTVPTLGAAVGLSYSIGRVGVKAGYRWDRYFNAIDGGDASVPGKYDRTIHGPYIKLSIGFGN